MSSRYFNLDFALGRLYRKHDVRHLRFLEVGTYDGSRAKNLLKLWDKNYGGSFGSTYYGFDLFEDLTGEMSAAELSKSRLPPSMEEVQKRLREVPHCTPFLYKGNTRETMPRICPTLQPMDLIFIDGGHSLDTVQSDWNAVRHLMGRHTIVLFDDYYVSDDQTRADKTWQFGCKMLIETLRRENYSPDGLQIGRYIIEMLDPIDHYEHTQLDIRMVKVTVAPDEFKTPEHRPD